MPRPVRCIQSEDQTVPVERLQNVKVVKGPVPEAPAATADEAYVLEIDADGAQITAPGPFGEIWGRVTLDQLVRLSRDGRVPCGRITDWPRLKWRGFMLDSVRNYLPPQGVKDIIDVMSRYKLNLFHWHLTEGTMGPCPIHHPYTYCNMCTRTTSFPAVILYAPGPRLSVAATLHLPAGFLGIIRVFP